MTDVKILLVEDESVEALDIKDVLESFGYKVPYIASSGEEAIEKASEIMPDIILMDIILKGEKDGIEAASEIKDLDIPIIYLTAHSEEPTVQQAIATEPYAYIIKPFVKTELRLAIEMSLYKRKMEKKLKENARSYRDLVDNSMVAIYKTNLKGDILFANEAMAEMFAYPSVEEFITKKSTQLYKNLEDREKIIKKLKKEGKFRYYEVDMISRTGEIITILLSAHLQNDIISGMIMDISKRKKSEKSLEKNLLRFRALAEYTLDGIITSNSKGKILYFNNSLLEMFAYSKDELRNSQLTMLMPERYRENFKEGLKQFQLTGKHQLTGRTTETIGVKKDGTEFPFEMSLAKWEIYDHIYFTAIIRDITERKLAEKSLKQSEKKYRTLFESNPDYTILVSMDGTLLDVNDTATDFMGLSREELIGKNFTDLKLFPEKEIPLHIKQFTKVLKGEILEPYQYSLIDKNGNKRWADARLVPLKMNGELNSILVIATDITDKKNAIANLKSSLNEKEVLLKEIHHRVKNNMQIISSLLNLQIIQLDADHLAVNVLKESQNRVRSMAMVHENLYLSNDLTHINLDDYIQRLLSYLLYSYHIREDQITLLANIEDIMLNIDTVVPCGLIITELVSNSLKHAFPEGKKGEIKVSLKKLDDEYELIIRDNGIGFPQELNYKKTDSLGLQLVNNLVHQIDGKIIMDANHGTEFKIIFRELEYKERI